MFALGGWTTIVSVPAALGMGIVGIVRDDRKLLAIATTLIAGAAILFAFLVVVVIPLTI